MVLLDYANATRRHRRKMSACADGANRAARQFLQKAAGAPVKAVTLGADVKRECGGE
jgi:hypothetical protein